MSTTVSQNEWAAPETERSEAAYQLPYDGPLPDPVSLQPAIQRWWWWFVLAAIISAPIAFFGAKHFATDSFVYDTRLIFNRSHFGAPLYEPPDIYAIAALASSPATLHEMKHVLKLKPDVERLEALLEPEVRSGSTIMSIELEWESAEKSKEILEWLSERLVTRVRTLRDQRIDHSLTDLKSQLEQFEEATDNGHKELVEFRYDHDTFGVLEHLRSLESEQAMLEKELAIAESEKDALEAQLAIYDYEAKQESVTGEEDQELTEADLDNVNLDLATVQQARDAEKQEKYAAVVDQIKQNRLEKSIREERQRALLSTQLEVKRRELSDAQRLYERRLIPQLEVQTLADKVRLLELELIGTEQLKEWEQELDAVTGRMDENLLEAAKKGEIVVASPVGSKASSRPNVQAKSDNSDMRDKWQMQLETKKKMIDWMHKAVELKQEEKVALRKVLPEAERLQRSFERFEFVRSRLEGQVSDLEMLRRSDSNLLAVLDPPSPGPIPMKSNKKKLMVAIYCLATCILCAPIVFKELLSPSSQHRHSRVRPR